MQAEGIVLADMLEHMQIVAAIAEVVLAMHLEPIDRRRAAQEFGVMGSAQTDADAAHSGDGDAACSRVSCRRSPCIQEARISEEQANAADATAQTCPGCARRSGR